jgi:hypothetical protein
MVRMLMVVALMMSAACDTDHCRAGDTRCRGENVEVCDAHGNWVDVANCSEVTASEQPSWQCCALDRPDDAGTVHACLPRGECNGGASR